MDPAVQPIASARGARILHATLVLGQIVVGATFFYLLRAQGQPLHYYAGPGGHSFHTFWTQASAAFRFYAAALAAC